MPNFRYRALTQSGELVNGSISAPTAAEVAHRIEYLGLVPIDTIAEEGVAPASRGTVAFFNRPRPEDVTVFTRDMALLLKAGARLDDGLELLADDKDIGRLRPIVGKIRAGVMAGESFADAIAQHPTYFPPIYVALVRVGETSGKLTHILEMLAERTRAVRSPAAQTHRRLAIPGLHSAGGLRRAHVFRVVRAAAVFFRIAGLRREIRFVHQYVSQSLRVSARARTRIRRPVGGAHDWRLAGAAPAGCARGDRHRSGADTGNFVGLQLLSDRLVLP